MMSRKDYRKFAEMLAEVRKDADLTVKPGSAHCALDIVTIKMCDIFKKDNPNFDRERFKEASGYV
jgi:hypothetical protein